MDGDMETLRERANRWIDSNPDAMRHFAGFAEQLRSLGRRFGIGLLAERVRWEMTLRGGDEDFKINNNYRAYIARRLIADDPRLVEHMRFRVTKAANLPASDAGPGRDIDPRDEV
jgi:hypothetical protein